MLTLDKLGIGKKAKVKNISSDCSIYRRLQDIGLIENTKITCLHKSPCGDPIAYDIRGAVIALRTDDTKNIIIELLE